MKSHPRLVWVLPLLLLALVLGTGVAWGKTVATPLTERELPAEEAGQPLLIQDRAPGDPVDFATAVAAAADYLRVLQADITDDNAENGTDGVDETPDDPDDGGWDWVLNVPGNPLHHSTAASPTNIYGATVQGMYRAYLASGDAAQFIVLTDAADGTMLDSDIDSGPDIPFLINYNDLPGVVGTAYRDEAKVRYDAKIAAYTDAQGLAEYIRDVRYGQGYGNGIIAWDISAWVKAAARMDEAFPGQGYDADADAMAEVIYQDSFNDNPGYFDIIDDQGWTADYSDKNFWWYNLGISGIIEAFHAADVHTGEIPGLIDIMLHSQYSFGAMAESYGTNPDNEDWQTTAYCALALAAVDQSGYQLEINRMAYWLGATQDGNGGWLYSSGNHYPEIGGECLAALTLGTAPSDVIVDDDFASQADVDVYNDAHGTSYVWGYDAFASIQDAIDAVVGSTITIGPGTYEEQLHITADLTLIGDGVGSTTILSPTNLTDSFTTGSNDNYPVIFVDGADADISGVTVDGAGRGNANVRFVGVGFWNGGGSLTDCEIIGIRDTPFSGAQHGVAVYSYNDTGGPYDIAMTNVDIADFQKNALALIGDGLTVALDNVSTTGAGPTSVTAQNGIQISVAPAEPSTTAR